MERTVIVAEKTIECRFCGTPGKLVCWDCIQERAIQKADARLLSMWGKTPKPLAFPEKNGGTLLIARHPGMPGKPWRVFWFDRNMEPIGDYSPSPYDRYFIEQVGRGFDLVRRDPSPMEALLATVKELGGDISRGYIPK